MFRTLSRAAAIALGVAVGTAAFAAPANDFTLRDVNGNSFNLAEHKGEVIVLSFWATWCAPCKEEMPHLQKMLDARKDKGLLVVSISADDARTASKVKPFVMSKGFTFPVLLDKESSVSGIYNPGKSLPYTVVIGRDFQVVQSHAGFDPGDEVKLAELVDSLLGAAK